jgi:hypothetical protein
MSSGLRLVISCPPMTTSASCHQLAQTDVSRLQRG